MSELNDLQKFFLATSALCAAFTRWCWKRGLYDWLGFPAPPEDKDKPPAKK